MWYILWDSYILSWNLPLGELSLYVKIHWTDVSWGLSKWILRYVGIDSWLHRKLEWETDNQSLSNNFSVYSCPAVSRNDPGSYLGNPIAKYCHPVICFSRWKSSLHPVSYMLDYKPQRLHQVSFILFVIYCNYSTTFMRIGILTGFWNKSEIKIYS
jgi:hypothetical protein